VRGLLRGYDFDSSPDLSSAERLAQHAKVLDFVMADPDRTQRFNDQIRTVRRTNLVQARKFSEQLEEAINRYTNRTLSTAEIIAELVKLAKELREDAKRHEALGLHEDEIAF
jgi:type I site-specific restriction-modification system R (restriction) subunit